VSPPSSGSKNKPSKKPASRALLATCFMLVSFLVYSSTLKTEVTCSSETPVVFQRTTWRYIPEDRTLRRSEQIKFRENLNHIINMCFNPPSVLLIQQSLVQSSSIHHRPASQKHCSYSSCLKKCVYCFRSTLVSNVNRDHVKTPWWQTRKTTLCVTTHLLRRCVGLWVVYTLPGTGDVESNSFSSS
jgi:hypothetical protein